MPNNFYVGYITYNEDNFGAMTDVAKSFQNTLKEKANIKIPEINFDELIFRWNKKMVA